MVCVIAGVVFYWSIRSAELGHELVKHALNGVNVLSDIYKDSYCSIP